MNKKLVDAINDQITYEFFSSHLYLAMSSYAVDNDLPGIQNWLLAQAEEEREHANKLINYIQHRNSKVVIQGIDQPKTEYTSILEVFEDGHKHEQIVTSKINNLMEIAHSDNDFASVNFLNWFVDEQVEEEASFIEIVGKLRILGDSPIGLYQLDKELGSRPGAPVVPV